MGRRGVLGRFQAAASPREVRLLLWVLGVLAVVFAVVGLTVLPFLLWLVLPSLLGPPEAARCEASEGASWARDDDAAERLRAGLVRLPGVADVEVGFDDAGWPGQAERVRVRVGFVADVPTDQVLAVVAPAVEGLRGPEFRGLDTRATFTVEPGAEFELLGPASTALVVDEAASWSEWRSRFPGARVQVCEGSNGGLDRTAEVPVVWGEDPAPVVAAFAELGRLTEDPLDWEWVSVRAEPGPSGPPGRATFTSAFEFPYDEAVEMMASAVRRPPSMSPTDELEVAVISYASVGEWGSRSEVHIEFGLEELRNASAEEVLAPGGRAQRVAAEFAAQVEAAGMGSEPEISCWGTRIR
jgi:hypothetical protein